METTPVAILAGGKGTRLVEETVLKPKPMVEVGGKPILWHIMKGYLAHGFTDFIIALGYKGEIIEDYIRAALESKEFGEGCSVYPFRTGLDTSVAGRIKRILGHTKTTTMVTYGDGVSDVDLNALLKFHRSQKKLATLTAVHPPSKFGKLVFDDDQKTIVSFTEKPSQAGVNEGEFINGGFMVLEPEILGLGEFSDDEVFERVYLPKLAKMNQLSGFIHTGFWQCMDTATEKEKLNEMWNTGNAKWMVW